MSKVVNFKKVVDFPIDIAAAKITEELKKEGFGPLTTIDFAGKMKEKLNKDLPPLLILGFCNPGMAFEAYTKNPDVTSLLPCNVVLRSVENGKVSVEVAKPSALLEILGDNELFTLAQPADVKLEAALNRL
jgi:uncharacterized protein (DUF302 family)